MSQSSRQLKSSLHFKVENDFENLVYKYKHLNIHSGAAKDQILGWTPTGGRLSGIIHQMKAKNIRIQKLRDAGTKKLYKQRYRTVSMATFLK